MLRRNLQCSVLIVGVIFLCLSLFNFSYTNLNVKLYENQMCYTHEVKKSANYSKSVVFFEDLMTSFKQPTSSKAIFYVNINCSTSGLFEITPR